MNKKHRWRNEGFNGIASLFIRCLIALEIITTMPLDLGFNSTFRSTTLLSGKLLPGQAACNKGKKQNKNKIITITCRWLLARLTVDRVL